MDRLGAVPGLAVAVYMRDGAYVRGFGVTDVETGERADADTSFYIASSTKPLTALALAALHERGEIDLDESLPSYAPDAPFPDTVRPDDVTFRHLLSHTGGVANGPLGFRLAFTGQHDAQTLWRLLASCTPNEDAPLGEFDYTNDGYDIATVLSDRVLGVTWQDLLAREIFSPAGMVRSTAIMSHAQSAGWSIAKPHRIDAEGRMRRIYLEKTDRTMQSAGDVIMSANDALRWLELMIERGCIGRRHVAPAGVIETTRAPLADVGETFAEYAREQYGLGWYLSRYRDERLFHHFGGFAGARAHVSYMLDRGVGVAAFVNDDTASFAFVDAIANYVYDLTANATTLRNATTPRSTPSCAHAMNGCKTFRPIASTGQAGSGRSHVRCQPMAASMRTRPGAASTWPPARGDRRAIRRAARKSRAVHPPRLDAP